MRGKLSIIEEDAASWLAMLEGGALNPVDRQRFETWRSIPSNAAAFEALSALYRQLDTIGAQQPLLAAREAALRRAERRSIPRKIAFAASVALIAASGSWIIMSSRQAVPAMAEEVIATQVGQGATMTLADKSRVTLDADTEIAVGFSSDNRNIRLNRGRAYFEVEKDVARPFMVSTRLGSVRATGTEFSVSTRSDALDVVLREGGVQVVLGPTLRGKPRSPIAMRAGTMLTANAKGWAVRTVSTDNAVVWAQGFIVFDNARLADAVAELNAYSHRKIVLNADLVDRRISGTFRAGRPEDFAKALSAYGMAKIEQATPDAITVAAAIK